MTPNPPVRLRIGEDQYSGSSIEPPSSVSSASMLEAIRTGRSGEIVLVASDPQPVHDHVGYLHPEMGVRTRTALARAGRSRGMRTPFDDELETVRDELSALDAKLDDLPAPSGDSRRQTAADTSETVQELQEDVAAARGRLQVCRDNDLETAEAAADLETAIRTLSEERTSQTAAHEALDVIEEAQRERREILEKRFRLEDRKANLEREARAHLVDSLREQYIETFEQLPVTPTGVDPFAANPLDAGIAIARLAALQAPVVISCDRFDGPDHAHSMLDAPIVYL